MLGATAVVNEKARCAAGASLSAEAASPADGAGQRSIEVAVRLNRRHSDRDSFASRWPGSAARRRKDAAYFFSGWPVMKTVSPGWTSL